MGVKAPKGGGTLKGMVAAMVVEEGIRLGRKYGPIVINKVAEKAIEQGPILAAKAGESLRKNGPPAAKKVRDGISKAGRRARHSAETWRAKRSSARSPEPSSPDDQTSVTVVAPDGEDNACAPSL